jgi:UDPglucose--hexose-1-phosphate uridylyltransferase
MSQLRLDPLTGRWVVVSLVRGERPNAFLERTPASDGPSEPCAFCPGHEDETPEAIKTYSQPGSSDWDVRVIPNLYPAFTGHEPMAVANLGPVYMQAPASGSHEVVVFSPDHKDGFADLGKDQLDLLMSALRDRVGAHSKDHGLRYSQVIINFGREAGASMEHPHAQLLGMPFVPRELTDEQGGFARFRGNCIMCATIESEEWAGLRMVYSDDEIVVFCPFWSGTPYEMMIVPRQHEPHFNDSSDGPMQRAGRAIQTALLSLRDAAGDVAYNIVFHSAPFRTPSDFHWHIHLLPKITTAAGFELGTGVPLNVVAPEAAASELRVQSQR